MFMLKTLTSYCGEACLIRVNLFDASFVSMLSQTQRGFFMVSFTDISWSLGLMTLADTTKFMVLKPWEMKEICY